MSGLTGTLVLQNNGADDLTLSANGSFTFATAAAVASTYSVTVKTQPASPAQICTVANASGTIAAADITNVAITCTAVPLTLSGSTPASGATGVARDVVPVLTFSTNIDAATTVANISLSSAFGAVPVSLAIAGAQIFVTPGVTLAPSLEYTLDIGIGLRGTAGERLASATSLTFTTAGVWSTPVLIEHDDVTSALRPRLAIDDAGNALAVWDQSNGTASQIHANRYANGWGTAAVIGPGAGSPPLGAFIPSAAFDGAGNAIVAWHQNDPPGAPTGSFNVWWTRSTSGGAFASPAQLSNGESAGPVQIAVNAAGDAVAVWWQLDPVMTGSVAHVWSTSFTPGGGWTAPQRIVSKVDTASTKVQVAIDAAGNALAVWMQPDVVGTGARLDIWATRYVAGGGWEAPQLIETDNAGNATDPQLAMEPNGNAFAVWQASDGIRTNIWANRFVKGTGWGTAALIEASDVGPAFAPRVAADGAGNAIAVWVQYLGPTVQSIVANRFTAGVWGMAAAIESDDSGDADTPQIAINASGVAHAVWVQYRNGSRYEVMTSGFAPGSGWDAPTMISTEAAPAGQSAYSPQIAVNASGIAQAVWGRPDGARGNLWSSRLE